MNIIITDGSSSSHGYPSSTSFFGTFDAEGFPTGFFNDLMHGSRMRPVYGDPIMRPVLEAPEPTEDDPNPEPIQVGEEPDLTVSPNPPITGEEPNPDTTIPLEAVPITRAQWEELVEFQGLRRFVDGEVVVYDPPPPPYVPIEIAGHVFFARMTDDEAEAIDDAMMAKPLRIRRMWSDPRVTFVEGTELWTELRGVIVGLYGEARADELLARPTSAFAAAPADDTVVT